jgi:hypothetical protein
VAPEAWSGSTLGGWRAVVAQALSDEGDDLGLTDRVGPPVSEREAMAETDKRSGDGQNGQAEQAMGRLCRTGREEVGRGWAGKIREEAGPKPFLGLKSNRVKENQF